MTDVAYYRQILKDQTELLDSNIEKYLKILDKELDRLPESGKLSIFFCFCMICEFFSFVFVLAHFPKIRFATFFSVKNNTKYHY